MHLGFAFRSAMLATGLAAVSVRPRIRVAAQLARWSQPLQLLAAPPAPLGLLCALSCMFPSGLLPDSRQPGDALQRNTAPT